MKKLFLLVIICFSLVSCDTTRRLASGHFSKEYSYKVNAYYSCCGCEGKYFNIYYHKKLLEQIIYSYNCGEPGRPTKYVFNYKKRHLVSCNIYVATTDSNYALQKLSNYEKYLFLRLDTTAVMRSDYSPIKLSQIKGFRKLFDKEAAHPFPWIKKGYKLPVH